MTEPIRKYYILNYAFVVGLILLCLNDHVFKWEYSNWITGKLSDFIGIFLLPMFLTYFFPKRVKLNIIATVLFFIFWKSPFSQSFIDLYNRMAFIEITRVVDNSDLIALIMAPFSFMFIKSLKDFRFLHINLIILKPIVILVPTAIIFMATAPPHSLLYTFSDGELTFRNFHKKINLSEQQILNLLERSNYQVVADTVPEKATYWYHRYWKDSLGNLEDNFPYYKIDSLVIEKDILTNFQFALEPLSENRTKVWINGMNIPKDIPDDKVERELRKYYKNALKKHFKKVLWNK